MTRIALLMDYQGYDLMPFADVQDKSCKARTHTRNWRQDVSCKCKEIEDVGIKLTRLDKQLNTSGLWGLFNVLGNWKGKPFVVFGIYQSHQLRLPQLVKVLMILPNIFLSGFFILSCTRKQYGSTLLS